MVEHPHPAAQRVVDALVSDADPLATLATEVSGADLTSFLLEVAQRRAAAVTPADLVRRIPTDRLVEPGTVDARALHRTVARLLDALPEAFEVLELSPVAPLGTCSAVATVDQKKLVSTLRAAEVAGDPTNLLAVVAAGRADVDVRLAAAQRVLRAQPMGAMGQQHFTVLGLVTTGRDRGNLDFERSALVETCSVLTGALGACDVGPIELRLTSLRDAFSERLVDDVRTALPRGDRGRGRSRPHVRAGLLPRPLLQGDRTVRRRRSGDRRRRLHRLERTPHRRSQAPNARRRARRRSHRHARLTDSSAAGGAAPFRAARPATPMPARSSEALAPPRRRPHGRG